MKILVVDDHPLIREAVQAVVARLDPVDTVLAAAISVAPIPRS